MRRALWAAAVALGLLLPGMASAHPPEAAIAGVLTQWEARFNAADADGLAQLYTEDAALLPPDGARVDGRPAIAAFWQGLMDGGLRDADLESVEIAVFGDQAVEAGVFALTAPDQSGAPMTVGGKYMVWWRKGQDGDWRLYLDIWNMGR